MQVLLDLLLFPIAPEVVVLPEAGRGQQVFLVGRVLSGVVEARIWLLVVDDEPSLVGVDPK